MKEAVKTKEIKSFYSKTAFCILPALKHCIPLTAVMSSSSIINSESNAFYIFFSINSFTIEGLAFPRDNFITAPIMVAIA